jgi:transcription elongation GreA/GreB family factor
MSERLRAFSLTQEAIKKRFLEVGQDLTGNSAQMSELEWDGDMMDDPLLLHAKNERMLLYKTRTELARLTNADLETISPPASDETVNIGHAVRVSVKYPDGEVDSLNVTIGSALDKKFLSEGEIASEYQTTIISEESTLARAILGKKVGDEVTYRTASGEGIVRIFSISSSPLARGKQ